MDIYQCGDCQESFDLYENFLIHKLLVERYELLLEPSERIPGLRVPRFIKKSNVTDILNAPDTNSDETTSPTIAVSHQSSEQPGLSTDEDADDNVSISSQTQSLRIDETTKDNLLTQKDSTSEDGAQDTVCKTCGKCYKNKVILRVHQETVHSDAKPYICKHCRLAFKHKGSLVRHTRTHTGERPYKCKVCKKAFYDSGTLCRHLQKLHPQLTTTRPKALQVLITKC